MLLRQFYMTNFNSSKLRWYLRIADVMYCCVRAKEADEGFTLQCTRTTYVYPTLIGRVPIARGSATHLQMIYSTSSFGMTEMEMTLSPSVNALCVFP